MNIGTLIDDVHQLFNNPRAILEHLPEYQEAVRKAIVGDLCEEKENDRNLLRLSRTGVSKRKLYFENKFKITDDEDGAVDGELTLKYLTGHMTEALLLFLIKEAGHAVEYAQLEVILDGVPGHVDAVIDGHLVDIKTASHFGFDKFTNLEALLKNDPFGYLAQLAAYHTALTQQGIILKEPSYFMAYNKSNSKLVLLPVPKESMPDAASMLSEQKKVLAGEYSLDQLSYCYPDSPSGKSGNMEINKNCYYCPFRDTCRGPTSRKFLYSDGVKYLTKVVREPNVEELK